MGSETQYDSDHSETKSHNSGKIMMMTTVVE